MGSLYDRLGRGDWPTRPAMAATAKEGIGWTAQGQGMLLKVPQHSKMVKLASETCQSHTTNRG